MRLILVTCLAVVRISAAPPLEKLTDISEEQTVTTTEPTTTITTENPKTAKPTDTSENEILGPIRLTGKERESLIGHIDLKKAKNLVLTPRQQMALTQELEYQQLGLKLFSDPTPWQRLTREEQQTFNNVYLTLPPDIQEFSKIQFLAVPDDIQEHAFRMFLNLDIETLIYVIGKELQNEQEQTNNKSKQISEDDELILPNEQTIKEEQVAEKDPEYIVGKEEKEVVKDKFDKEEELEVNEEVGELDVDEEQIEVLIQELDQPTNEEKDLEKGLFEKDEHKDVGEERKVKNIEKNVEETPLNSNITSAIEESSIQTINQKLIKDENNVKEVAIERLNKEIENSPDYSFEELGVPFLTRRQETKRKNNIQYQARKQFVEKRKQILTEQPRGPLRGNIGRRQSLTKQSRGALRRNIDRRAELPQRRNNLIHPRNQRQRS